MAIEKFVGIGTQRSRDVFDYVLGVLESERPTVIALDENPITLSTLIQMRCSEELNNEKFVMDQKQFLLKRKLDVGNSAGILYAMRQGGLPIYFVDGSFCEPLSETGKEIGIYPYFTSLDFAASADLMRVPIALRKGRIPIYPGWDFEYELIHAYQTDAKSRDMDRAIWQRNQFTALALNRIIKNCVAETLAFIGDRKRFRYDLYRATAGVMDEELTAYRPLDVLLQVKEKVYYDAVLEKAVAPEQPILGL